MLGVYESRRLTPAAEQFDTACGGYLGNLLRRGDLEGKPGQSLLLFNVPEALCERVLLVLVAGNAIWTSAASGRSSRMPQRF